MGLIDFSLGDVSGLFTGIREALTGEKIVDPIKAQEMAQKLIELEQKIPLAQIELLKADTQHYSTFVAGWRPAIGWVGAISLFLMYVPKAIVMTAIWTYQCIVLIQANGAFTQLPIFPELGAMDIIGLVGSMLGIAGLRSWEKFQGVDTKQMKGK